MSEDTGDRLTRLEALFSAYKELAARSAHQPVDDADLPE